jgi:hypothetical protein
VSTTIARQGDLIVERDPLRPSGRLLRQGEMEASYVDLADPSHLEFDYMRWMRIVLRSARARRVLHVGGGACALPRALAAEDRQGRQEVCEVDPDVLALAREHMGLRRARGLRVRLTEGRAFISRQAAGSWDAVAIDAFVGATVPPRLITVQAMADVARVAPLALVNVLEDRGTRDLRAITAGLGSAYALVWALQGRTGNAIVVGSARELARDRIAALLAADPSPARFAPPDETARRIAGTVALRDEEVSG